ncbi:MAG: hypothetical protein KGZ53_07055 [Peptococcaceae bacterium]|nr:hypothetical protein [Peptococcaceae bacterium]
MDGTDLLYRSRMLNLDLHVYLAELKQAGLYGVASHVTPLLDLEALGDVLMKPAGNEASQYARSLGLPAPLPSQSILEIKAENLRDSLTSLVISLTSGQVTVYGEFVYTELPYQRLRRTSLGFSPELIAAIDASGLAFLPVFSPYTGSSVREFTAYLKTREFAGVMFTGNRLAEDLGAVQELAAVVAERQLTIYWLQRSDTLRGYVPLEGIEQVLNPQSRIVRSYRISRAETDNPQVNPENMVSRWLGSIKEYNTRAIYMRPFYRENDISLNAEYVALMADSALRAGYTLGPAEPFARYYPFWGLSVLVGIGIGLLALTVALRYGLWRRLACAGFLAVVLSQIALFSPLSVWLRLALGLFGAIIASFAGISLAAEGKNPWLSFVGIQTATISFALLTASYLSDYAFITEFEFFRGVKLQYTLPLFILAALVWLPRWRTLPRELFQETKRVGLWVTLVLGALSAAALFFYIRRSGHVHSVSQLELGLRFWLDEVLVARPRFKELVAHPLLLLVLFYRPRLSKLTYEMGLVAAAIGQVSIVNTFMHLRTPLALSLLRVFHGLWIGTIMGLLGIAVVEIVLRLSLKIRGGKASR